MAVRGRIGGSMSASGKASELEFFVGFDPACSPLTGTKLFSSHPLLIASGAKPVVYEWALKQPADLAGLDWLVSASSPQPFPLQGVVLRDRQGADYFDFFCSAEAQAHSPSRAVILEQLPGVNPYKFTLS